MVHKGVHELATENIVVVVVFSSERIHHRLKFIYIYIPKDELNRVDCIAKVRFEIVDTFIGENDQLISDAARKAVV